jgi:hypothetical protein
MDDERDEPRLQHRDVALLAKLLLVIARCTTWREGET